MSDCIDIMRLGQRFISDEQVESVKSIKCSGNELWALLDEVGKLGDPRLMAIAKTNLEQAIMWATKALT